MLLRQTLLFLSRHRELEDFLKNNPLTKNSWTRFITGETREDALKVARDLCRKGFAVQLDYLGEAVSNLEEVTASVEEYCDLLKLIEAENLNGGIAVKLSHLGLEISEDLARENLLHLATCAGKIGRLVRVDMEGAKLADRTLGLVRAVFPQSPHLATIVPACLERSSDDIEGLNDQRIPVTLVKGPYLEPQKEAFHDREDVILYFMRLIETLMRDGKHPAFATHDEKLIEFAIDMAFIFGLDGHQYEFQMLYGVCPKLQEKTLKEGYQVRISVPYGTNWYPYFMRRLAEYPTNLWRLMREKPGDG